LRVAGEVEVVRGDDEWRVGADDAEERRELEGPDGLAGEGVDLEEVDDIGLAPVVDRFDVSVGERVAKFGEVDVFGPAAWREREEVYAETGHWYFHWWC